MVAESNKLIFIHVPKTGGFTVRKLVAYHFGGKYNIDYYHNFTRDKHEFPLGGRYTHMSVKEHKQNNCNDLENYFIFCFVRNPWDRVVSEFEWRKGRGDRPAFSSFDNFVKVLSNDGWEYEDDDVRHTLSQSFFVKDEDNNVSIDYVGRFESFGSDLRTVFERFNKTNLNNIPHINKSCREIRYQNYYSRETRKIIEDLYREDIERFNYCFR